MLHGPSRDVAFRKVVQLTRKVILFSYTSPSEPRSLATVPAAWILFQMAPAKKELPAVSAFERKRFENIASNQAILKDLSTSAQKIIPKLASKPKSTTSRKRATPVKKEPTRPTRTSSRLAGVEADSETLKRKAEVEEEFTKEAAKSKRQRVAGDIHLSDVVAEGKKWSKGTDFLSGVMRGAVPNQRTFTEDDIRETTDEDLKSLRQKMSGLELYEGYEPHREFRQCVPM